MQAITSLLLSRTGLILVASLVAFYLWRQYQSQQWPFSSGSPVSAASAVTTQKVDIVAKSAPQLSVSEAVPHSMIGAIETATQDEALPTGQIAPVVTLTTEENKAATVPVLGH